jgi:TrmH family RNA methyltransferase
MQTMALSRLVLVAPSRFPHPDADALASGATEVLDAAVVVATLDAALEGAVLAIGFSARPREFAGSVLAVRGAAAEALRYASAGDVALVFGSEMSGLSNAELARCQIVATIPSNPAFASLNLAAAVQIAAYELQLLATGGDVWTAPAFEPATQDEIAQLFAQFPAAGAAQATTPQIASAVRARTAGKGRGEHSAWHRGAHRGAPWARRARGSAEYLSISVGYEKMARCLPDFAKTLPSFSTATRPPAPSGKC